MQEAQRFHNLYYTMVNSRFTGDQARILLRRILEINGGQLSGVDKRPLDTIRDSIYNEYIVPPSVDGRRGAIIDHYVVDLIREYPLDEGTGINPIVKQYLAYVNDIPTSRVTQKMINSYIEEHGIDRINAFKEIMDKLLVS